MTLFFELISSLKDTFHEKKLKEIFYELSSKFNKESTRYNDLILLRTEHRQLDDNVILGVIDYTTENLHLARIRGRLLNLIDSLVVEDLIIDDNSSVMIQEIGNKDLPSKILITINEMTPDISNSRIKRISKKIKAQTKKLDDARDKKDELASIAVSKLKSLNQGKIKDAKLYKKYFKDFIFAFKEQFKEYRDLAKLLKEEGEEIGILCLYQIESSFRSGELKVDDFKELIELLETQLNQTDQSIDYLNERIDEEKYNIRRYNQYLKIIGVKGKFKNSIKSKVLLKDSITQLKQELKYLLVAITNLKSLKYET